MAERNTNTWLDTPDPQVFIKNSAKFNDLMMMYRCTVREGESRVERQFIKWTAEGTGKDIFGYQVFCDVRAYVSCREYEGIPPSARVRP